MTAVALMTGFAAFTAAGEAKPPEQEWVYGPVQKLPANGGLVVVCQRKTNSRAFAAYERAEAGDVVIETCRATRP